MRTTAELLPIGVVASRTGVAVTAIRYYEELGLVASTTRIGGKRRFSEDTIGRINFVKRAKEAGLSLDDIAIVLDEARSDWQSLVDAKLTDLHRRRDDMERMIGLLTELRDCGCEAIATCEAVD